MDISQTAPDGADSHGSGSFGSVTMVETRRIVSFLPSATEMICALGLGDRLLGVTHECDYPPEIVDKPIVVRNVLPIESMSQSEIDSAVTQRLRDGLDLGMTSVARHSEPNLTIVLAHVR